MKTQTKQQRSIPSLSTRRWTAYMAAAAASTFAGASSSEAEIHYSGPINVSLTRNAHANLPLSNGASLVFQNSYLSLFYQKFYFLTRGVNSGSAREWFSTNTFRFRRFLSKVPSQRYVSHGDFGDVAGHPGHGVLISGTDGSFTPPTRGFVAFRFNTGNGTQYGWARIQTRRDINNRAHETIKDYAWGDVGDRIRTGQKSSSGDMVDAVTDSGSVGLLALGAAGLVAWRKRREPATQ